MKRLLKAADILLSVFAVSAAAALIIADIRLYANGTGGSAQIYTYASISEAFTLAKIPVIAFACMLIVSAVIHAFAKADKKRIKAGRLPAPRREKRSAILVSRIAVFLAAAVLTVIGVMNGGLRDVFVKAINICTECIGLG